MADTDGRPGPWWGSYPVDEGETACWRIGPLRLWLRHGSGHWQLAARREAHADFTFEATVPCAEELPEDAEVHRYCLGTGRPVQVMLEARLPDRPLVWRPAQAISIPPGEEVTLFLCTPLWVGLRFKGTQGLLWEGPLRRLSDTWFGAPTERGGFAYSADRDAFLLGGVPPGDSFHAVTPITIRNGAGARLDIKRLKLPVPHLSLFASETGAVWTQRVTLERGEEDEELALLRLGNGVPRQAGAGVLLSGPRLEAEKNLVFQAFSRLYS